jgi:hypothetical protein
MTAVIGWKKLDNATKWHFFNDDGRSLCGRWMTLGRIGELGNDDSPDDCAACRKKVKRLKGANKQ